MQKFLTGVKSLLLKMSLSLMAALPPAGKFDIAGIDACPQAKNCQIERRGRRTRAGLGGGWGTGSTRTQHQECSTNNYRATDHRSKIAAASLWRVTHAKLTAAQRWGGGHPGFLPKVAPES